MILRLFAVAALVTAACTLWLPFDSHRVLHSTKPGGSKPAGEIRKGFELSQRVILGRKPLSTGTGERVRCFAIQFATYHRKNAGHLEVHWRQANRFQVWRVDVSELADNAYRHYCPDPVFLIDRPFNLRIRGADGQPGRSPTLWLVGDRRFGTAELDGGDPENKALALQITAYNRVTPASMLRIDHGAFLFGWLCTLAAGTVSLLWALSPERDAE